MNLADRVRGVLKPAGGNEPPPAALRTRGDIEEATGGEWRTHAGGRHFVVERRIDSSKRHGGTRVGDMAAALEANVAHTSLLTCGAPACAPFVFLDLETTGLSGGAGTFAFLVGCGSFSNDGSFVVRQHLMVSPTDEPAMLRAVAGELEPAGALVSFNGKSFDAPVLETRYLFHRLVWPAACLAHLDALHPARHFWGEAGGCSLAVLESQVLGTRRMTDVAGMEIPARYFQFLRTGDARLLGAVLDHNRLDLLSLAGLTSRLVELVAAGPSRCRSAQEAFALGRIYRRSSLDARAHDSFVRAFELAPAGWSHVRTAALHALALSDRHARRYEDAAVRWKALVDAPDSPALVRRAAAEALAVHHEHRVGDLPSARAFALKSLESPGGPAWRNAVRRRLNRIDRKLGEDIGRRAGIDPPIQLLLDAVSGD